MEVNYVTTAKTITSYSSRKLQEAAVERSVCVCVCVCVWERERQRQRDIERNSAAAGILLFIFGNKRLNLIAELLATWCLLLVLPSVLLAMTLLQLCVRKKNCFLSLFKMDSASEILSESLLYSLIGKAVFKAQDFFKWSF